MTRKWYATSVITLCIICLITWQIIIFLNPPQTIKIGILHSLTGSLAISERPVVDAALLAITEINKAGGVLGQKIEYILADGQSEADVFAAQAEKLITQDKVVALFGCWTSPSRNAVKKVVEKYNSLLFYPVQFEGLEDSPHVIYTSTTPNQQLIPGVTWCLQHLGKKFFLIGSDLIMHEIIKDVVYAFDGTIVGDKYQPLGDTKITGVIEQIITSKPDVILNNMEGDINIAFFTELRKQGITPEKIPTMSFSFSEPELQFFNTDVMTGDYTTWSYFESIENAENKRFVEKIKKNYGKDRVISDAMEAMYVSIYFWAHAVEKAKSTQTKDLQISLKNQPFNAPQGIIHINDTSQQTWQFARIGKIRSDKQFTVVWSSQKAIRPMPYPITRTPAEWQKFLAQLEDPAKGDPLS
jgi:urea transport system substrate-binding protein